MQELIVIYTDIGRVNKVGGKKMSSVLSIEFCTSWGYDLRAVALIQQFVKAYRHDGIESFNLIPSGGGVFEVKYNGKLIYSKKAQGIFPEVEDLLLVLDAEIRGY